MEQCTIQCNIVYNWVIMIWTLCFCTVCNIFVSVHAIDYVCSKNKDGWNIKFEEMGLVQQSDSLTQYKIYEMFYVKFVISLRIKTTITGWSPIKRTSILDWFLVTQLIHWLGRETSNQIQRLTWDEAFRTFHICPEQDCWGMCIGYNSIDDLLLPTHPAK